MVDIRKSYSGAPLDIESVGTVDHFKTAELVRMGILNPDKWTLVFDLERLEALRLLLGEKATVIFNLDIMSDRITDKIDSEEDTVIELLEGRFVISDPEKTVKFDNKQIDLTQTEYNLLLFFAKNQSRAYTRADLMEQVWGYADSVGDETVKVHVFRLRAKLKHIALEMGLPKGWPLITVRGSGGYRFYSAESPSESPD